MNHGHCILLSALTLLLLCGTAPLLSAQALPEDSVPILSIFDELALPRDGQGTIYVLQSTAIRAVVHRRPTLITRGDLADGYSLRSGYRVQVFSSNAPGARATASARARLLEEAFPEIETDVLYRAPFWSVRTGSFVTRAEAQEFIARLKEHFPSFAREIYVVPSKIKVPL